MKHILLLIAYILNVIDYLFTAHWVRLYGIEVEGNPFGRWLFENNLAWAFKILALGALFALVGYLIKRFPKFTLMGIIPLVAYAFIDVYHIVIFFYLKF